MIEKKLKEIRDFCKKNANPENVKKYSRYFKDGFDGYGIDSEVFEAQKDDWITNWKNEMTIDHYLDLGDKLMQTGKMEEKSFAIAFITSERKNYTLSTFDRIGKWFDMGIDNWATTDVLCMLVLPYFIIDKVISYKKLAEWNTADCEWQRRAVPVTLDQLSKVNITPETVLPLIEPLMPDNSEYVQKGIGTLLRSLWKKYPEEIEKFMLKWKERCGRLIIQYATEKMDKEYRQKFRKSR